MSYKSIGVYPEQHKQMKRIATEAEITIMEALAVSIQVLQGMSPEEIRAIARPQSTNVSEQS